jgi:hypothetical protein
LRLLLFFCEFLLPALSASSLRSAPGGIAAAPEQPFLAAQALSPCDAARTTGCGILSQPRWAGFHPLSRRSETKTDAPVVSRFLYRLTPTTVCCTRLFVVIWCVFLLVFLCVCGEAGIFFALTRKLTRLFASELDVVWYGVCIGLLRVAKQPKIGTRALIWCLCFLISLFFSAHPSDRSIGK